MKSSHFVHNGLSVSVCEKKTSANDCEAFGEIHKIIVRKGSLITKDMSHLT